jgi:hypothetical protein
MTGAARLTVASAFGLAILLTACGRVTASGSGSAPQRTPSAAIQPIGVRPSSPGTCRAVQVDFVSTYEGLPTPAKAIADFIASKTADFPLPKTGWTTVDHHYYTSGKARLEMSHLPHAGYAVSGASSC